MSEASLTLARQGVFHTVQGEGALMGLPMVFVRLAGCSVGCAGCDTDYRVAEQATLSDVVARCRAARRGGTDWAWLTGGEPTDQPGLDELVGALHAEGFRVALATSGTRPVQRGFAWGGVDFLSVSPHDVGRWVQRSGDQLNLVPGLGGLTLTDPQLLDALRGCEKEFGWRYVTPCDGLPATRQRCLDWVACRRGWRLGVQAHKSHAGWGVA